MKTMIIAILLAAIASAADLNQNFAAAGLGFQSTANPQTSGWVTACHRNPDITLAGTTVATYSCASTDYSGTNTSARVEEDLVLINYKWFSSGVKAGGGAALNTNGVGGSYAVGGWAMASVAKFMNYTGIKLVASATWNKDNINTAITTGKTVALVQLAARGVYRFGFGKSW